MVKGSLVFVFIGFVVLSVAEPQRYRNGKIRETGLFGRQEILENPQTDNLDNAPYPAVGYRPNRNFKLPTDSKASVVPETTEAPADAGVYDGNVAVSVAVSVAFDSNGNGNEQTEQLVNIPIDPRLLGRPGAKLKIQPVIRVQSQPLIAQPFFFNGGGSGAFSNGAYYPNYFQYPRL